MRALASNVKPATILATLAVFMAAAPALATEQRLEAWLNPSVTVDVDDRTFVELETAQRLRNAPADDTYSARLWLGRQIADGITLSAGAERRYDGDARETRLLQQLNYPLGPLKARTRFEQRLLSADPRSEWRLRQRIGSAIPLCGSWDVTASVEGFFVLRASEPGAQTGLSGVRTFIGLEREFGNLTLSAGYLRVQTIRNDAPDTIGHAPFLGGGFAF